MRICVHVVVSKGGFTEEGTFHPLPWIDTQKMALLFRDKVFTMLIKEGKISESLAQKVSSWAHSGFNIHNGVEIDADDEKGKENLAQYIIKAPISQERMLYDKENQKVIYNSKRGTVIYEPLDWECPKCHHEMRIIALIEEPKLVKKILKHLNLWHPQAHSPPVNNERVFEDVTYDYTFFNALAL